MKIKKLIKELTEIMNDYGNIDVLVNDKNSIEKRDIKKKINLHILTSDAPCSELEGSMVAIIKTK